MRNNKNIPSTKKKTGKRLKCFCRLMRKEEEHILRSVLCVDIPRKRREKPNLRIAGLREDDITLTNRMEEKLSAVPATPDDGKSLER